MLPLHTYWITDFSREHRHFECAKKQTEYIINPDEESRQETPLPPSTKQQTYGKEFTQSMDGGQHRHR